MNWQPWRARFSLTSGLTVDWIRKYGRRSSGGQPSYLSLDFQPACTFPTSCVEVALFSLSLSFSSSQNQWGHEARSVSERHRGSSSPVLSFSLSRDPGAFYLCVGGAKKGRVVRFTYLFFSYILFYNWIFTRIRTEVSFFLCVTVFPPNFIIFSNFLFLATKMPSEIIALLFHGGEFVFNSVGIFGKC